MESETSILGFGVQNPQFVRGKKGKEIVLNSVMWKHCFLSKVMA